MSSGIYHQNTSKKLSVGDLFIVSHVGLAHSLHDKIGILTEIELETKYCHPTSDPPKLYKALIDGKIVLVLPRWLELFTTQDTEEKNE